MDLSKVYDYISDELFVAKLDCCDLDELSLNLTSDYLSNCKQRTK